MKIVLASDHAGYRLKSELVEYVKELGHEVLDVGTYSEDSCDYPDFARAAATKIKDGQADLGILVCGTGLGMSIAANKIRGIRAVTCSDTFSAHSAREHNDANVLCLGGRVVGSGLARDIVKVFLESSFQGGRHKRRVDKIEEIEATSL